MFAYARALVEYDRLMEVSVNTNPSEWDKEADQCQVKLFLLNCRSMKNKFSHVKNDKILMKADLIVLTETWLDDSDMDNERYELEEYMLNLNNIGRGRGIASYYNKKFKHAKNTNCEGFSLSKFESEELDVIGIYRSQEGNVTRLITELNRLIKKDKSTVIGGDLNICALAYPRNYVTQSLGEMGFKQLMKKSTHIEGGLLDHVYLYEGQTNRATQSIEVFPKY